MVDGSQTRDNHLREASMDDIAVLASHHRKMFEEIWARKGEPLGTLRARELESAYTGKLEIEMEKGLLRAWFIEDEKKVVSSGAITLLSLVPNPLDLSSRVAYLHSMYTETSHRNSGYAQRIIKTIIEYCNSLGIKRILLNASDAGKPFYEKIGFHSAPDAMRLFIE